ncbi:MAG: hypothetical protein K5905_05825 [Roseibium sp.]|uniref:hypothetical protein n=1 Tax=Roseibium sp. TaxID=1936156 RepID=UPI0026036D71|nr:hypothetical protein [Roseibium sp.]MCV0424967.1 hypothetical protein [Roseibium sp.]
MKTITVVNDYPVSADRLWALAVDYDALGKVMKGIVSFEGLPNGRAHAGQKLDVRISLFDKFPKQEYYIEILECNDRERVLTSNEKGAGVKHWLHKLQILETETGSRLIDKIEIDAGWLTPIFAIWARYLYSARHKPRLNLLKTKDCQTG